MKKAIRFLAVFIFVFLVGGLGSFFLERSAAWLAGVPGFSSFSFLKDIGRGVTIVKPIEQVIIRDGKERDDIMRQAQRVTGKALLREVGRDRIIGETNGVFVTSDGGFLVYAPEVIDRGKMSVVHNAQTFGAQLLRVDSTAGLALLQTEGSGFPVALFRNSELSLGEDVFFLWREEHNGWHMLRTYIAQSDGQVFSAQSFADPPSFSQESQGAALFDRDAKLVGLLGFRADRTPQLISAQTIQQFLLQ